MLLVLPSFTACSTCDIKKPPICYDIQKKLAGTFSLSMVVSKTFGCTFKGFHSNSIFHLIVTSGNDVRITLHPLSLPTSLMLLQACMPNVSVYPKYESNIEDNMSGVD